MSRFWEALNKNPGAYGPASFEGSLFYDPAVVTPIDSMVTGQPVSDNWHSGQMIDDNPVVPASDEPEAPEKPFFVTAPVNKPEYINASLAEHYGMDVATAYQEALANTAHQREIKDLQAAGLNPVLSARYSGASGVSGASVMQAASRSGSGSSSGSSDSGFSLGKLLAGAALLAGAVAGIATKSPKIAASISSATTAFSRLMD